VPQNKLWEGTNFIIFGPTDQKLWVFENFGEKFGKAGMCLSQLARIDYISPKKWTARIRRFEKALWEFPLWIFEACLYTWKGEIFHSSWCSEISFCPILFLLKLEYTRTFISTVGIFIYWNSEFIKNSSRIASMMEIFCTLLQCKVHLSMFHSSPTSKI
jgi:hypothetical protein